MNSATKKQTRRKQFRRGVIIPLLGFMLIMIFGLISFVADIGNVIVVKTTLGAAADAAALAGAGAMAQSYTLSQVRPIAVDYGLANVPDYYGTVLGEADVKFGIWDPEQKTFSPNTASPNAVKVRVERTSQRNNAVPYSFAKILGFTSTDLWAEAIAVGANSTSTPMYQGPKSVYVTSTKDLSNVVLNFGPDEFGNPRHQKFQGISGYSLNFQGTGEYEGLSIVGVWIKSGCNGSNDGPGYGEYIANPGDGYTTHGDSTHHGCTPHVTATFETTEGVEFTESGAASPVRLVK